MAQTQIHLGDPANPLDTFERIALSRHWRVDRAAEDEVNMVAGAAWGDVDICLNWREDLEGLHVACSFDFKVQPGRQDEVARLLHLINEQLYFGHFDLWRQDGTVVYRNGLILAGGTEVSEAQCEALICHAVGSCERYYPSFQFVMWAGKSAEEAIEASMLECLGEA